MVITPLLTIGCTPEKASALTPPVKKIDTNQTTQTTQTKQQEQPIQTLSEEYNQIELLADLVQENIETETETIFEEEPTPEWVEMSKEEEIILTAQEYMGTKYVWAANGPDCFDCSGFTRYVYKQHGMTLPRYSGNQAKVGMKVSFDELQIGDLVFFDTEKKYRKKVNHVGIYIGDGKFIHASSAKKQVTITSFRKKKFYKNRFLWGQRVVNTNSSFASL